MRSTNSRTLVVILITIVVVLGVLVYLAQDTVAQPSIGLNSPTTFPVDI